VLSTFIDALCRDDALERIIGWAKSGLPRYVCLCNVHSVVHADRETSLQEALHSADLCIPDGAPIAWRLRRQGYPEQRRIAGPDLALDLFSISEKTGIKVFLYGGDDATLRHFKTFLLGAFPALQIGGMISPPFQDSATYDCTADVEAINDSGAGLVFLGLGCPKQERWMKAQSERLRATCIGVGAAFDFLSGRKPRAPVWMQENGMEWLHRLISEPRRLASRYIVTNSLFVLAMIKRRLSAERMLGSWGRMPKS
jgi:N-acetylglucosaminyldiphosphoundecaprenol N-acetyl-beta-D-mannosaminyltransferase